jgi:hypothetical protein
MQQEKTAKIMPMPFFLPIIFPDVENSRRQ